MDDCIHSGRVGRVKMSQGCSEHLEEGSYHWPRWERLQKKQDFSRDLKLDFERSKWMLGDVKHTSVETKAMSISRSKFSQDGNTQNVSIWGAWGVDMRLGSWMDSQQKMRRTRRTLRWKQEGSSPLRKDSKCRFMKQWITNSNSIAGEDWEWWRPGWQTLSLCKVQLFCAGRLSRGPGDGTVSQALSPESVWWGGHPAAPIAIKMMHRKGWWPGDRVMLLKLRWGWWYENLVLMRSYDRSTRAVIRCN